jgi:asparagine synthase (glutamine-hydrolysing)
MLHAPDYACVVHVATEGCVVGHVSYPEYPIAVFRTERHTVCLEGTIRSRGDGSLTNSMSALAKAVLGEEPAVDRTVRDWILAHDGDYLIVLVTNDGKRLAAITDPLGRLPVYFTATERGLWLARECKFVLGAKGDVRFDRLGWAEQLWLGYPLGERTLFEGVRRACGGMLLESRIELGRVQSACRALWTLNCEVKSTARKPLREHAADLIDTFVQSVQMSDGAEPGQVVLSLSGGRDSRAVAAALARGDSKWVATSRLNADGRNREDVEAARRIAASLGVPWYLIELDAQGSGDAKRLVWLKDGLNFTGMAFILAYLERVLSQWGRAATYVTGDGGDKAIPDLRPQTSIRGRAGLLRAIGRDHVLLPAATAEGIMQLTPGTLEGELDELLRGYPEDDLVQKAVHFVIYERCRKWLFEGEDRNRFFMWQFSPFYSLPVFRLAMQIPDPVKAHSGLYIEFQRQLNPALARIPDANNGLAMDSLWLPIVLRAQSFVRRLPVRLKAALGRSVRMGSGRDGRLSAGPKSAVGRPTVTMRADSIMAAQEADKMLARATQRQRQNWETLVLLEQLW